MFSKEEAKELKKEFWIQFSNDYPKKWLLHNTKIKDVALKFIVDNKKVGVAFSIENKDDDKRKIYFEKLLSLKNIIIDEYFPEIFFEENVYLTESNRYISNMHVSLENVTLHNKNHWKEIFNFFNENMIKMENFFYEYENYIKDLNTNI